MLRGSSAAYRVRHSPLVSAIQRAALSLGAPDDLDPLLERIGDARFVLLGEATHGTAEFYEWRAEISRRLIREKGFSFIAVEGDWPDCYRVNRYVKAAPGADASARDALHAFSRWPTWMWANRQVVALAEWLRSYNEGLAPTDRVGFYGLDVYSLWESIAAVVEYLERVDPDAVQAAKRAHACFEPYYDDVHEYARAAAFVSASCEDEVVAMLRTIRARAPAHTDDSHDGYFNAEQNALVVENAERYYRTMLSGGATSWNLRDTHMVETLERLMAHHGDNAKAIVWEHNTHVGDARFTDMAREGMFNVGQLVREAHGESPTDRDGVVLVGFGTRSGAVLAGSEWGAPMQRMRVPEARDGSWEDVLHRALGGDGLFVFDGSDDGGVPGLDEITSHRAIGVVYDPRAERWGNYVPTLVPRRYDAFLFIDQSRAVDSLHVPQEVEAEVPETFPTGM